MPAPREFSEQPNQNCFGNYIHVRYDERANLAFVDGHAKWINHSTYEMAPIRAAQGVNPWDLHWYPNGYNFGGTVGDY